MHLGKPLQRRMVTPRPEALPDPVPVDEDAAVQDGQPVEPPVSAPQPTT